MKKTLYTFYLLLASLVLFFAIQLYFEPQLAFNSITHRLQYPLDTRLRYRIGIVDPRFHISEEEVKTIAAQAVEIWHRGLGKQVFVYDEHAKLSINLIYDERQAKLNARHNAQKHIQVEKEKYQKESEALKRNKIQLEQNLQQERVLRQQFQIEKTDFEHLQAQYQQTAHPHIAQQLNTQQHRLAQLSLELDRLHQKNAQAITIYNQQVDQVNTFRDKTNESIEQYHQKFQPSTFQQGVFTGQRIDIFTFQSLDELRIVLAHELGHGLHISHHDDPQALMYPLLEHQDIENFQLQPADIELYNNRPSIWTKIEPH